MGPDGYVSHCLGAETERSRSEKKYPRYGSQILGDWLTQHEPEVRSPALVVMVVFRAARSHPAVSPTARSR